jgi:Ca2+-binding EF-hand superfamily protein
LYDVDGDGKISKNDLKKFLSSINTKDEMDCVNPDNTEEDNNIEDSISNMINIIMKDIITNNKRKTIDYNDFKTLMWNTNIDRVCVIYLEEE